MRANLNIRNSLQEAVHSSGNRLVKLIASCGPIGDHHVVFKKEFDEAFNNLLKEK